jgi:MFS family permease
MADFIGPFNIAIFCALITAIVSLCLIAVNNSARIIIIFIFYGFFSGALAVLCPMLVIRGTPEQRKIGTWLGMVFAAAGVGLLIGNPISGAFLRSSSFKLRGCFLGFVLLWEVGFLLLKKIGRV